jgi:HK97 family phage major capsid protein
MVKSTAMALAISRFMNAQLSTGLTSIEKLPGVVGIGTRPLTVKDLIASGATTSTVVRYIQETVFTNTVATVGEGAAKPEQVFAFNEVDANVKKIAAWTKMSEELYADFLAVASFINQRLPYLVERVEEDQLLNGDGVGNNLVGILNTVGIQTQAKSTDTAADAIFKAMTKVRWANMTSAQGGFEPDGIVMHPTDWQNIRLSKDTAGQYFGGGPFTGAYGSAGLIQFEMLWGKPVSVTPAIAAGKALVGAFRLGAQWFQRQGVTVETTNTDQDDFIKNLMTIRAESRLALAVYRPVTFCTVTGL